MLENRHTPSDRDPYRDRLGGYLGAVLQRDVLLKEWDRDGALPMFLTHLYKFFETRIGQTPLLFMFRRRADDNTPAEIRKHVDLAKPEFEGIVVYSAERLTASFRARLVAAGVAFAVPGNQLFIPELATDLREHFRARKPKRPDQLSPSAQLVLFFHLLSDEPARPRTPTELKEPLQYSIMTMSRAFDELAAVGLARIEQRGRKKLLSFRSEGRLLIDSAKTLLVCPQRRLDHIRWRKEAPDLPLAGEHALAQFSDLSPPAAPPVYAVAPEQMRDLVLAGWTEQVEADYASYVLRDIGGTISTV